MGVQWLAAPQEEAGGFDSKPKPVSVCGILQVPPTVQSVNVSANDCLSLCVGRVL